MNIPSDPSAGYIAIIIFLIGLFLFISGLNIITIEKITVSKGKKTWMIGLILMISGSIIGIPNVIGLTNQQYPKNISTSKEKIKATLDKVIYYPGDKGSGNYNSCPSDTILVREIYSINSDPLDNVTLVRSTSNNTTRDVVKKITINGLTDYNVCMPRSLLNGYKIKTVFVDDKNRRSDDINFTLDVRGEKLVEPSLWENFFSQSSTSKNEFSQTKVSPGIYRQTFVKPKYLGECPQCTITITETNPGALHIESNNGWYGTALYDKTTNTYKGTREWLKGQGGNYNGIVSNITIFFSNDAITIDSSNEKVPELIQVTYQKMIN